MPTIPQRIASAFAVLRGRYGDVTAMAKDRDQSRQSLYREAEKVVEAVDGSAAEARIDDLRRQLADREAENRALRGRLERAVEITRDVQEEFAAVAQAEGVSLGVARRLLDVVAGSEPVPERGDAGAGDAGGRPACRGLAGGPRRGGPAPRSSRRPPMRFFGPQAGLDGGRAREPLLDDRPDGRAARRGHLGGGVRPAPGASGRGPRRRRRPG